MTHRVLNSSIIISVLILFLASPVGVLADVFSGGNGVCNNGAASQSALCQDQSTTNPLSPSSGSNGLILTIANIIALVAGIAAVIVIILAGLRFVTSGGNPAQAEGARSALTGALIGLVVIALADTIIRFVLGQL